MRLWMRYSFPYIAFFFYLVCSAHNLSQWNLYQKTSQLLVLDMQQQQKNLPAQLVLPALQCMYYAILWQLVPTLEEPHLKVELDVHMTQVKHFCQLCRKYMDHENQPVREQAFLALCDLLMLLNNQRGGTICCVDSGLESRLLSFVQRHVFQGDEEKGRATGWKGDDVTLDVLHRRRMLLAVYCKLIASGVVEMSAVAEIYKQYMKTYNDFGDIIKETLSRTRQNNRIESAKSLVLCLKQLFLEHREACDSATQSSSSFTNMKELARRFSLTFGMDHVKCRESIAMMHKQGIEFAFREPATEVSVSPPNLPFLLLISEFSSKLLRADKRMVYGYIQRFANEQMLLHKGKEWNPLVVYSSSLLDNPEEESSSCVSSLSRNHLISSTGQHLRKKSTYEHIPGRGLAEKQSSNEQNSPYPTKSKRREAFQEQTSLDSRAFDSHIQGKKLKCQNTDESNEDVDVDEMDTDQTIPTITTSENEDTSQ